jgi:hypothetical protein
LILLLLLQLLLQLGIALQLILLLLLQLLLQLGIALQLILLLLLLQLLLTWPVAYMCYNNICYDFDGRICFVECRFSVDRLFYFFVWWVQPDPII